MTPRHLVVPLLLVPLLPGPQEPAGQAAALQRTAALAAPGEPHARLARLVGRWQVETTTTDAAGEAHVDRGTLQGELLLGGRYVQLQVERSLAGGPLRGLQILGFHALHQVYTSSWRDDHSTWSVECSGAPGGHADRLVLHGTLVDARDPAGRPFRYELDFTDERRVDVRVFDTQAGALVLRQTQRWTRA
ncbi:MAG: DUF1579 family protein [Planctomycetes bacterium]|nr:DUF1579 family protein [Planctomycetota bacterium]